MAIKVGDKVVIDDNGNVSWTDVSNAPVLKGPKGAKGPKGGTGPQGPEGPRGLDG